MKWHVSFFKSVVDVVDDFLYNIIMFILIKPKPISSKSRVYLVKSYRDVNGKAKHEFVKCYGSYNELIAKDPNFINNLKKETKSSSGLVKDKITIDPLKPSN
jgi:hypothetical protein